MKKLDLRKDLKYLYQPSAKEVELVRVPKFNYLMVDGVGDPNGSQMFHDAAQALYTLAYTLKFMIRNDMKIDYPVMALEGLWWTGDATSFDMENRSGWKWTLMILQPAIVTKALFKKGVKLAIEKKGLPMLSNVRLEALKEGLAVQIMHIGPYAAEGPTLQKLHAEALKRACIPNGKHHEIYFGDPRKTKPEKLKTVLRQPISKAPPAL